jgi:hypothetical protein
VATSGTVGLTTIDATDVLEHAVRRCGVLASVITAEIQLSSRQNLSIVLNNMAVLGMSLWCVEKQVYALDQGNARIFMERGTEELLNVLLRTGTQNDGVVGVAEATYTPASAEQVAGVILGAPAGTYAFVVEGSPDGVTWTVYGSRDITLTSADRVCIDVDPSLSLEDWRARDTTAASVIVLDSAVFVTGINEVDISPMNLDSYASLPNKFAQGRPTQYRYDKALPLQSIYVWPTASASNIYQVVAWVRRQIQDVGALSNTLEIPDRWWDAVIFELSTRVCLELPAEIVPQGRYDQLMTRAALSLNAVLNAEIDHAPFLLQPVIRGYTR